MLNWSEDKNDFVLITVNQFGCRNTAPNIRIRSGPVLYAGRHSFLGEDQLSIAPIDVNGKQHIENVRQRGIDALFLIKRFGLDVGRKSGTSKVICVGCAGKDWKAASSFIIWIMTTTMFSQKKWWHSIQAVIVGFIISLSAFLKTVNSPSTEKLLNF